MSGDDHYEYQSGPFCRHWSDPSDCEEKCARCGHKCVSHGYGGGETQCEEDACECESWVESEE